MDKLLIASLCALSLNVFADEPKVYDVKYGFSKTLSTSQTQQLGKFGLILKGDNLKRSFIYGSIHGVLDPATLTLSHTLVNTRRTGSIITQGDTITNVYSGDPYCTDGVTPFNIEETLFIVAGTGIYSDIEAGSYITVEGTVNNCAGSSNYLQNDFKVTGGKVTFK